MKDENQTDLFIVELEKGVYLAEWDGDPGRTLIKDHARTFKTKESTKRAINQARSCRPFPNAKPISINPKP